MSGEEGDENAENPNLNLVSLLFVFGTLQHNGKLLDLVTVQILQVSQQPKEI